MVDARQRTGRRGRQPNRAADQLAQLRQRNNDQLADARERERRVDDALRGFVTAGARIDAAAQAHAAKVRRLQARISALDEQQAVAVADDTAAQAQAALVIHECGRTVGELAELLALSQRAVARMLRDARSGSAAMPAGRSGSAAPVEEAAIETTPHDASAPQPRSGAAPSDSLGARDAAAGPTQVSEIAQPERPERRLPG